MFKQLVFLLISLEWFAFGADRTIDNGTHVMNRNVSIGGCGVYAGWSDGTWQGDPDPFIRVNGKTVSDHCQGRRSCEWWGDAAVNQNYEGTSISVAAWDNENPRSDDHQFDATLYPDEGLRDSDRAKVYANSGGSNVWCNSAVIVKLFTCTSRVADSSNRCSHVLDPKVPVGCYAQLNTQDSGGYLTTCNTMCPAGLSDGSDGKCVLKPCPERVVNTTHKYPCGTTNCYQLLDRVCNKMTGDKSCGESTACHTSMATANINTGTCDLKACASRTPVTENSLFDYPCGKSDCYQLLETKTGSLKEACGTACPTNLSTVVDGKCELKDCPERTKTNGYTYPCGTSDCFQQLDPTGDKGDLVKDCVDSETCPRSLSDAVDGICQLKTCSARVAGTWHDKYPCGTSDCFRQRLNGGTGSGGFTDSCNNNCNPYHFKKSKPEGTPDDVDIFNGTCEWLECPERVALDRPAVYPCGTSTCYQQISNGGTTLNPNLNTSCGRCDPRHFEEMDTGVCELKHCETRVAISGLTFPCGTEDCHQQMDNGGTLSDSCDDFCDPRQLVLSSETHRCEYKNCSERVAVSSHALPCGTEDCYRQVDNGGTGSGNVNASCDVSCDPRHFVEIDTLGVCELKKCERRVAVPSLAFPCGTEDCHQQVNNGGTGSGTLNTSCGACDSRHFLEETGGICKLKKCKQRVAVEEEYLFPCGTEDCHQQISNGGKGSGNLNASCGACDPRHFLESETGQCKLKKCEKRVSVLSLEFPCGTEDCYQQTSTENGTCDNSEPAVIIPPKSQSRKTDPTVIIIVVVVTVVVMVAVLVIIIILILVFRRGHKQTTIIMEDFNSHSTIGDYSMGRKLGEGKFGEVFEVSKDGQSFAARRIHKSNTAYSGDLDEFSPKISSEFLVKYFGIIPGDNDDELYVLMELCNQGTLYSLLEFLRKDHNDGGLAPGRVLKVMIQLLLGLDVLHRNSIVHRGLKPSNIFIDQDDNVKIGDFADNKLQSEDEKAACLTVAYTPKEVLANHQCTTSSDMYSLGVILYELCSLSLPYSTIMDINTGEYKSISRPDIPEALSEIIYSLLDMNPNNRPSAFGLLQNDFVRGNAGQFGLLNYFPSSE